MRYERTGEFRAPRKGEWYEAKGTGPSRLPLVTPHLKGDTDSPSYEHRWILREVTEHNCEYKHTTQELVEWLDSAIEENQEKGCMYCHIEEMRRRVRVVGRLEEYLKDPYANSPDAAVLVFEIQGILKGEGV